MTWSMFTFLHSLDKLTTRIMCSVILFLAPISCFDQMLAEDPTVPRIVSSLFSIPMFHHSQIPLPHCRITLQQDSVLLWKSIVTNNLLAGASLVLFLNKIDIMKAKLASGIVFGHHISSYPSNRPNDFEHTSDCGSSFSF